VGKMFGFLRAINVGGRRLKMTELAAALRDIGLANVDTFIASGNVVFDNDDRTQGDLGAHIECGLSDCFGFKAEIFLRSAHELSAIIDQVNAAKAESDVAINVGFMRHEDRNLMMAALAPWQSDKDRFDVHAGHYIWFSKTKMSDTPFFNKGYSNKATPIMTVRTYNTIERMVEKWAA
jgi:uncharacterized protein (DUF1697 family)